MMDVIETPEFTMPAQERDAVTEAYKQAGVILEYGSGGSTVLASGMQGKRVFSVESDRKWAKMMQAYLDQNGCANGTEVDVIWADIGPTRKWGYPKDDSKWESFASYPLAIWGRDGFVPPDVVLVDGRFRTGCAMAAAFRTPKPVVVMVDDYQNRKPYHMIEAYLGAPELHGRLAKFHVQPMAVPADKLIEIIAMMTRP